jgi:hypothetical protein
VWRAALLFWQQKWQRISTRLAILISTPDVIEDTVADSLRNFPGAENLRGCVAAKAARTGLSAACCFTHEKRLNDCASCLSHRELASYDVKSVGNPGAFPLAMASAARHKKSAKIIPLTLSHFSRIDIHLAASKARPESPVPHAVLLKALPPPDTISLPAAHGPRQPDTRQPRVHHCNRHIFSTEIRRRHALPKQKIAFFCRRSSGTSTSQIHTTKRPWAPRNRCAKAGEARAHGTGSRFLRLLWW